MKIKFSPIENLPPMQDGETSKPYLVYAQEWGCAPVLAFCRAWKLKGQKPKWYFDRDFYDLPNLREIAHPVIYFGEPEIDENQYTQIEMEIPS